MEQAYAFDAAYLDVGIGLAMRDILLSVSPALVPRTTLSAPHASGSLGLTVDAPGTFQQAGPVMWTAGGYIDNEEMLYTAGEEDWDGESNPVPLTFTGLGYQGLIYDHPQGEIVYTNLFVDVPSEIDDIMGLVVPSRPVNQRTSEPVVWVSVRNERGFMAAASEIEPAFSLHLEYRIENMQPVNLGGESDKMHPAQWSARVWKRGRLDMNAVVAALVNRWHMEDRFGVERALGLGDTQNPLAELYSKTWSNVVVNRTEYQFAATLDVSVRGSWFGLTT